MTAGTVTIKRDMKYGTRYRIVNVVNGILAVVYPHLRKELSENSQLVFLPETAEGNIASAEGHPAASILDTLATQRVLKAEPGIDLLGFRLEWLGPDISFTVGGVSLHITHPEEFPHHDTLYHLTLTYQEGDPAADAYLACFPILPEAGPLAIPDGVSVVTGELWLEDVHELSERMREILQIVYPEVTLPARAVFMPAKAQGATFLDEPIAEDNPHATHRVVTNDGTVLLGFPLMMLGEQWWFLAGGASMTVSREVRVGPGVHFRLKLVFRNRHPLSGRLSLSLAGCRNYEVRQATAEEVARLPEATDV